MARSSAGISTLERTVQLLATFSPGVRDLSLTQMAHRAGLPLSSASSLVRELVRLGLLERTEGRHYRIGLRLWELASNTPGVVGLRETALPHLQRLQDVVGQHSQLAVLDGTEVLFLERLSGEQAVVNYTLAGTRMPFYASSSGMVLAAFADAERRERLVAAPRPRYALEPSLTDAELRQLLAEVRKVGQHRSPGWVHADAMAMAVPVHGAAGSVVAALALVVPSSAAKSGQGPQGDGLSHLLLRTAAHLHHALARSQMP